MACLTSTATSSASKEKSEGGTMASTQRTMVDFAANLKASSRPLSPGPKNSPDICKTTGGLKDKSEKDPEKVNGAAKAGKTSLDEFFEKLSRSCPLGC